VVIYSGDINNPRHVPNIVLQVKPEIPYIWNTMIKTLRKGQWKGKH